jgi:hypothetical protein
MVRMCSKNRLLARLVSRALTDKLSSQSQTVCMQPGQEAVENRRLDLESETKPRENQISTRSESFRIAGRDDGRSNAARNRPKPITHVQFLFPMIGNQEETRAIASKRFARKSHLTPSEGRIGICQIALSSTINSAMVEHFFGKFKRRRAVWRSAAFHCLISPQRDAMSSDFSAPTRANSSCPASGRTPSHRRRLTKTLTPG